jgi:hypothetical protein
MTEFNKLAETMSQLKLDMTLAKTLIKKANDGKNFYTQSRGVTLFFANGQELQ